MIESGVGIDACTKDDGGPLVCNDGNNIAVIFGVVSRLGPSCADPNYPGVYSEVSHALNWIKSNMVIPPFDFFCLILKGAGF